MQVLNTLKALPRFLILAPLFGAAVALIMLARSPGSASAGDGYIQVFMDQTCAPATCKSIVGQRGGCAEGVGCAYTGTVEFGTCRPDSKATGCTNSDDNFGHIGCVGKCQAPGGAVCGQNVYFCSAGVPPPLPPVLIPPPNPPFPVVPVNP